MKRLGWSWLLLPGLCAGSMPACFAPGTSPRSAPPFVGDAGYRGAPPVAVTPVSSRSPYQQASLTPPPRRAAAMWPAKLPERPQAIGFVKLAGEPLRPDEFTPVVAEKPLPTLVAPEVEPGLVDLPKGPPTVPPPPQKLPAALNDEPPVLAALRCYVEKRPNDAPQELNKLDAQSREVLLTLVPLAAKVGDGKLKDADPREVALLVDQLQGLLWSLRPRAALVMDKFCFCRQIRRFGVFEAMDGSPSFQPGEMVEVYAEIRNVSSQPLRTTRGDHRTYLRSVLDVRKPSGESVWRKPFEKPDETMTPQHDYFQHYRFQMPAIEPGAYVLHLEVIDVPTGRKVRQQMNFAVKPLQKTARAE